MEDKIFKVLVTLLVLLMLATPAAYFIGGTLRPVAMVMLAGLVVVVFITVRMYLKLGKDVMDFKCAVVDPGKQYNPGDTVSYTAEFTSKASFQLNEISVTLVCRFFGEKHTQVSHKEKQVHLQKKSYIIGNEEKIQGSFKMPDKPDLFNPRHAWELVFHCGIESYLDKTETIEFIKNDKTMPFWDAI